MACYVTTKLIGEKKMNLSEQEIRMGLMVVRCTCCGNIHKAHGMQNACSYSIQPNYGCEKCQGIPEKADQSVLDT